MIFVYSAIVLAFGVASVLVLRDWGKPEGFVLRIVRPPAEGVYAAPNASRTWGVWALFGAFFVMSAMWCSEAGVSAWVAFPLLFIGFMLGGIGVILWLEMPDNLLVPRAFRGSPGYLEVRGL